MLGAAQLEREVETAEAVEPRPPEIEDGRAHPPRLSELATGPKRRGAGITPGPAYDFGHRRKLLVVAGVSFHGLQLPAHPLEAVLAAHAGLDFGQHAQAGGRDLLA